GPIDPESFHLAQNYPNPFNPGTTIEFFLPEAKHVLLTVYDMNGREVAELLNQHVGKGNHVLSFEATNLSSGIYFYTINAGSYRATKKMMVLR
ncbi:MAG: T9SS type A sorting domain-containing protein, partial [Calditrichia bacterium]